ncbi:uncharacterized protein LOC120329748 [Styela clava]
MNSLQVFLILLTLNIAFAISGDKCADGTYKEGETYSNDGCVSYYYRCVNGIAVEMNCPPGTVYDSIIASCDWPANVDACKTSEIKDCKDSNGNPVATSPGYTKPGDCNGGIYYVCKDGKEEQQSCPDGLIYVPEIQLCNWADNVPDCDVIHSTSPESEDSTTTTTTTTTTTSTGTSPVVTITNKTSNTTSTMTTTTTTTGITTTTKDNTPTSTITTPTTPLPTTTTTKKPQGKKYVGFVVDDTGSMSNEIRGVTEWIKGCVDGTSDSCGDSPTGGWIVTSFNDPSTGIVVGPTLDTDIIITAVDNYYPHGGGDCPEKAFTGLQNAVNVVPSVHSGCKMYLFTDATAIDHLMSDDVTNQFKSKNCALIPILTGCCGTCPDACESTDPDYCINHVTDTTKSSSARIARSTSDDVKTQFYRMSEQTGGNIYVTNKPSSPDDMLDFLEEEVTLGFCGSDDIAGPLPDGYKCEEDCLAMKMCWDKSVSKCYCKPGEICINDPMPMGYSSCAGEQKIECDPDVVHQTIPDQKDCSGYYQCNSGILYHFNCAKGTIFSSASPSYCDHPTNVPPPCGSMIASSDVIV